MSPPTNPHVITYKMRRDTLSSAISKPVHPDLSKCKQNHTQTFMFDIITVKHIISHVQATKKGEKRANRAVLTVTPVAPPLTPEVINPTGLFRRLNFKPSLKPF